MIAPGKVIVLYKIITYKTERRKTSVIVINVLTLVEECQKKSILSHEEPEANILQWIDNEGNNGRNFFAW